MKRLFITMLAVMLTNCYQLKSQSTASVDKWMEYVEDLASETEGEGRIEALYTDLSYLAEHPFELNTVSREQLKQLPFLSDQQIDKLLEYRARYGRMVSLYELKNVESLDLDTISLLLSFIYICENSVDKRPITVKNMLKQGSNELYIRYDKCFQQKSGYCLYPDSVLQKYPNRHYMGEPFYHSLRYSYTFDERIQFGVVGEKDMGEPFWNDSHTGYDYYSAHLFLKEINKWLKSLAVGDYKVSFGQGLVISNDFSPSRNTQVAQVERRTNGFRRHYSTNEFDFFRGVASTVHVRNMDISLFYSYRKLDAGVENNTISSFKTDGLHRLIRDREKQRTVPMQTYGGNIRYATPNVCVGLTALSYSFASLRVAPDPKPYNLFYFRGNRNMNGSVDYMLKTRWIKFYGETALSANGAWATLNAVCLTPASYFTWLLLYRYYDRRYQAFFGNAFSQNPDVQNEQGVYMGMQWTPFARWKLSAYVDRFRFPWLKYGVDAPSAGQEYMIQADYNPNRNLSFYIRYKYKQRDQNISDENSLHIQPSVQQRLRFQFLCSLLPSILLKTSADGILYSGKDKNSKGWMLSQSIGWKPMHIPFQADLYAAFFQTDDYDTRLSSYEKNILYAYTMSSFYGKGFRGTLSFRWNLLKSLSLSVKYACTYYLDRDVIGMEQEEIDGSLKTDLYTVLRWKF